ncbi:hypothetical protein PFISCL1PPCAC_4241, partial [Pristionchus fissidentatus]
LCRMWYKTQDLSHTILLFEAFENGDEVKRVADLIRREQWRIANILKNPGPTAADKQKITPGAMVRIEGGEPVQLTATIADLSLKISEAFSLNEMQALDLVLTAELKKMEGLGMGLAAVVLYYDAHRMLALILKRLLEWTRRDDLPNALSSVIKSSFLQRGVFRHLLDLIASFTVHNEFHTLATKHQGLGNQYHQNMLRSLIEETHRLLLDAVYLIVGAPDFAPAAVTDLCPLLKKLQPGDRFSHAHMVAWTALVSTISPKALQTAPAESSAILKQLLEEVRNETGWGDQCLCGSLQLAVAVGIRRLQLSPVDHAVAAAFDADMDVLASRAIINHAFEIIRKCIIQNEGFHANETSIQVADSLLKNFILLFPPKLMEIERYSEDELLQLDEYAANGSTPPHAPSMHFTHFLEALREIYQSKQPTEQQFVHIEALLDELSAQFGIDGSQQLVQFCEMATRPQHAMHSVAFLDLLHAVCRTQSTARSLFEIFYQIGPNDDGWVGWEQFMTALRSYERLFRDGQSMTMSMNMMGGGVKKEPVNLEKAMHKYELAGLVSWCNLATKIVQLDEKASAVLCDERGWSVVELAASLVAAPIPLTLKGPLLRLLGALGQRKAASVRVWTALTSFRVCAFDETGQMGGIQRELEEKECAAREYPSTLGVAHLLRSLLAHPLPAGGHPFLIFLTKSIIAPLGQRSYNNVHQMWELATVSLEALHNLVKQTHADTFAVQKRLPQVKVLLELLNDSPLFRSVFSIISEDVLVSLNSHTLHRPSAAAAAAALRLLLAAVHRLQPLRSAIRAADSDALLATLESLFFGPFGQLERGCLLTHIAHYISKSLDQPLHGLYAARLLRELTAVRPSLQTRIVHMLKVSEQLHVSLMNSVKKLLCGGMESPVRYGVEEVNFVMSSLTPVDECDVGLVHGETARLLLEVMAEGAEVDVDRENLASFLLGYEQHADKGERLFENDTIQTGFHSLIDMIESFIEAEFPLDLHYSALFEPAFRLLLRLVSIDAPRRLSILRYMRTTKTIYRLLKSPFIHKQTRTLLDETRFEVAPTASSVSSMITGDILHLAAIELSFLLGSGQIEQPRLFYEALLETNADLDLPPQDQSSMVDESTLAGCSTLNPYRDQSTIQGEAPQPLLFSLLRNGGGVGVELPEVPAFSCFDSVKVQKLLDSCRGSSVFDVEQYDVSHVHWLLQREITSINMDDPQQPIQEMESILSFVAALNASLLASGASSVLLAGCVTLLNVFAVHSPVPFFTFDPQLAALLDASFVLIESASAHVNDDVSPLIAETLHRVVKSACLLTRHCTLSDSSLRRQIVARLLQPLLELMVEPAERTIHVKLSIYGAASACLREAAAASNEEEKKKDDEEMDGLDWLLAPVGDQKRDPVRDAIASLSSELVNYVTRDILDLPMEHVVTPVRVLQSLLEEDAKGSRRLCDALSLHGLPRALLDLVATLPMEGEEREKRGEKTARAVNAMLCLLARMALSSHSLWRSLADLAAPELLMQLDWIAKPPKQLFLDPTTINKAGTSSFDYAHTLGLVLRTCTAMMSSPSWKVLSLQVVSLIESLTDLINQLMRAEVNCEVLKTCAILIQFIYQHDDVCRPQIDASRSLSALRSRAENEEKVEQTMKMDTKPSFGAPSRLFASLNAM